MTSDEKHSCAAPWDVWTEETLDFLAVLSLTVTSNNTWGNVMRKKRKHA